MRLKLCSPIENFDVFPKFQLIISSDAKGYDLLEQEIFLPLVVKINELSLFPPSTINLARLVFNESTSEVYLELCQTSMMKMF